MATFSDDFNRANGGLGSNWSTPANLASLTIVSNTVTTTVQLPTVCGQLVPTSVATFAADHEASTAMTASTQSGERVGPAVRLSATGSGYYVAARGTSNPILYRLTNGAETPLLTLSEIFAPGDVLKLKVLGTTLTVYQNGGLIATVIDSTHATGQPGIAGRADLVTPGTSRVDDFTATDGLPSGGGTPAMGRYRIARPVR